MGRVRLGLLGAVVAVGLSATLLAGCGTQPPSTSAPQPGLATTPPPTAPVGPDGKPITNLCDLLSEQDLTTTLGVQAKAPVASDSSATSASCDFGEKVTMTVKVLGSAEEAASALAAAVQAGPFQKKEEGVVGGIDESVYGTGTGAYGLALRRVNLVVTITAPGAPSDGKIKLIQVAALVLSRANALGT